MTKETRRNRSGDCARRASTFTPRTLCSTRTSRQGQRRDTTVLMPSPPSVNRTPRMNILVSLANVPALRILRSTYDGTAKLNSKLNVMTVI